MPKRSNNVKGEELNFITVRIRNPKKMIDLKEYDFDPKLGIKQVRGKMSKKTGYVIQSFDVALEYLGLNEDSERKSIIRILNNPELIRNKKLSRFIRKIIDTYEDIKKQRGKFNYKTKRTKRKRKIPQPKQQQTA